MASEEIKISGIRDVTQPKKLYLERYVQLCRFISMWPRENTNFFRYYAIYISFLLLNAIFIGTMFYHIFFHISDDIDRVAKVIDYATAYASGLFRYIYSYFKGKKYAELVNFMHENFIHSSISPGNELTMDKYTKVAKFICYSYIGIAQCWIIQASCWPFLQYYVYKDKQYNNGTLMYPNLDIKMAVETTRPFDTSYQPNAGIFYTLHMMAYFSMDFIYIFTDAFWFATLILATGQFELISHTLKNLSKKLDDEDDEDPEYVVDILNFCIDHHGTVREFVHKIEDLMHPIVLVDFLHAVASISFILLDMSIAISGFDFGEGMGLMGFLLVSIFHMYVLDYFGNELTLKEEEISMAFYEIPWYKYPQRMKNKIVSGMLVAGKPYRLTGGKLYNVSLEFFAGTMKTIFSYFMVLMQLRET